jgi:hypothetical protein
MAVGQLAINYEASSPGVYFKDSAGALVKAGPLHIGATAPNVSPAAGGATGNTLGEFWLDTATASQYILKIWDGTAWRSITVNSSQIADGSIVNADINASAAIAHSKLASMTSAQVLLGNASNVPTSTTVSGDVTISNTGVTAISSGVIVNADINASAAIAHSKLASLTAGNVLLGNASNVPTSTALSGDVTVTSAGVTAIKSSVALGGSPTTTTQTAGTNNTTIATTAFVSTAVDAARQGLTVKQACRAATTANITLSATQTIDGVAVVAGERVLVKNQTTGSQNGIYVVAAGAWTRATDFDADSDVVDGAFTFIEEGTSNADSGWVLTTDAPIVVGTTALAFAQFSGAGQITAGAGLTKSGNTLDVGTASTSRIVVNADNIDLATTGVGAGTYRSVTVDTYGRVTAGTTPTTFAGYGISDTSANLAAAITDETGTGALVFAGSPALTGTPTAPTAVADTNTTQVATTAYVIGQASSTTPVINGTAAVGTSLKYARADHVHASDTTKANLASPTFTGTPAAPTAVADTNTTQVATTAYVVGQAASANPLVNGTVAVGTSLRYARQDHVHPTDTTRAAVASPTFTGTPAAPTAAADTNTTQLATTAYVVGQAGSATPLINGTAAVGTSLRYSRQDHVHPTDTTRAPLASPTFTGTVTLPAVSYTGNVSSTATGFFDLPVGTTAQRPGSPNSGMIRFNTDIVQFEGYNGTAWSAVGGGARGGGSDQVFFENDTTVSSNYTITTNKNAVSAGPVVVAAGVTVTIPSGSSWVIV